MDKSLSARPSGMTNPVYTLSVASDLSGIPENSIRQYIDRGLILPYKKGSNRQLFSDVDIKRLAFVNNQLTKQGLNVAGVKSQLSLVPCWAIRQCSEVDRKSCSGYHSGSLPCWEASEKGHKCKNEDCRDCEVYQLPIKHSNLKELFQVLIP